MALELVPPRVAHRVIGDPWNWHQQCFCQSYRQVEWYEGGVGYQNTSDPLQTAKLAGRFVVELNAADILAGIVPPEELIWVSEDATEVRYLPPSEGQGRRVRRLFASAGMTPRFRGGIRATGRNCRRLAEVLSIFSFWTWSVDVVFSWPGQDLALMACHEADLHMFARDASLLGECEDAMDRLGLQRAPRPFGRPDARRRMPKGYHDD